MENNFIQKLVFNNEFKFRFSRHFLFWTSLYLFFSLMGLPKGNLIYYFKINLIYTPLDMLTTYILIYFIYPQALIYKRFYKSISLFLLLLLLHYILSLGIHKYIRPIFDPGFIMSSTLTQIFIDINILFITYASAIFIKTVKYLYSVEIKNNELTKKNLENKMAILTSQLHPHFLFNTFNNLYTLSKEKSEQVPNIILKLSEVIRYILYDYEKLYVKLTKELEIVKSYIDIEKLRYDNQLKIEFLIDLPENKKSDIFIPPLLLFTFVENAFKHGVSQSLNDCYIIIHIKTINDILHIKVENSTDELITQERDEKREKIGLQNIIDRLNLYYPNKHKLRINGEKNSYNINLELKMDTYEK